MPVLQHRVGPYLLDLAYPELKLMIEYDGQEHLTPQRAAHDLRRQAYLSTAGWEPLRFLAKEVFQPPLVAARMRAAITRRTADKHRFALAAADR
jgi:very-short-patch-repair endonuclease